MSFCCSSEDWYSLWFLASSYNDVADQQEDLNLTYLQVLLRGSYKLSTIDCQTSSL